MSWPYSPNKIEVDAFDKKGNLVGTYSSLTAAGEDLGLRRSGISQVLDRPGFTLHGYSFRTHGKNIVKEERPITIYGWYLPIEDKWYVGRTKLTKAQRTGKDGHGYRKNRYFYEAIQKHGLPAFEYHVLDTTTDLEESYLLEQKYVTEKNSLWPNGFNMSLGGKGSGKGVIYTEEHYQRVCERNRNVSEETRRKQSIARIGHPVSMEQREKLRIANLGKVYSEEYKEKQRSVSSRNKKVQQMKNGIVVKEFRSVREASRQTGVSTSTIINCCQGRTDNPRNYDWRYI